MRSGQNVNPGFEVREPGLCFWLAFCEIPDTLTYTSESRFSSLQSNTYSIGLLWGITGDKEKQLQFIYFLWLFSWPNLIGSRFFSHQFVVFLFCFCVSSLVFVCFWFWVLFLLVSRCLIYLLRGSGLATTFGCQGRKCYSLCSMKCLLVPLCSHISPHHKHIDNWG